MSFAHSVVHVHAPQRPAPCDTFSRTIDGEHSLNFGLGKGECAACQHRHGAGCLGAICCHGNSTTLFNLQRPSTPSTPLRQLSATEGSTVLPKYCSARQILPCLLCSPEQLVSSAKQSASAGSCSPELSNCFGVLCTHLLPNAVHPSCFPLLRLCNPPCSFAVLFLKPQPCWGRVCRVV